MVSRNPNTVRLHAEWQRLGRRYGETNQIPEVAQLEISLRRRLGQMKHLRNRLTEIESELGVLQQELQGIDKTLEMVLAEAIGKVSQSH